MVIALYSICYGAVDLPQADILPAVGPIVHVDVHYWMHMPASPAACKPLLKL